MGTLRLPSSPLSTSVKTLIFLLGLLLGQDVLAQIAVRGFTTATSNTASSSIAVSRPTGLQVGDLMIANVAYYEQATNAASSGPAGWTVRSSQAIGSGRGFVTLLSKVATATDVAAANFSFTVTANTDNISAAIVAFSGVNTTNPFDVTVPTGMTTSTNTSITGITSVSPTTANTAIVMFAAGSRLGSPSTNASFNTWATANSPTTLNEIYDVGPSGLSNNGSAVGAAWAIRPTTGSTGNGSVNCTPNSGGRTIAAVMVALRPACPTPNTVSAASSSPTPCLGAAMTNITHTTTGATGIGTPVGLPAGVTAAWSSNTITISGTPTATGTFSYSIPMTGGCGSNVATGTITVQDGPAVVDANICQGQSGFMQVDCIASSGNTSGPRTSGTGSSVTGIGTRAWSNAGNVAGGGNATVTCAVETGGDHISNYLQGSNYGFTLPSNAIISGITVTIRRFSSGTQSPLIRDNRVSLVKGGSVQATNKANVGVNWPTALTEFNYGGTTDLWGTTWTAAEINATNFGVVLSVINNNTNFSRTAEVDYMRVTVTYSLPGTTSWFTAVSGGSSIGSGLTFNPVGVAGSGLANTNTIGTTTYYVNCATLNSCRSAVDFVVSAGPSSGTISGAATVCAGTNSTTLTLSGSTGTRQWQSSTDNSTFTNIPSATGTTLLVANLSTTTYYRVALSNGSCTSFSSSVAMIVNQTPVVSNITGKGCTGQALNVVPIDGDDGTVPAGTTYTWTAPTGTGFTGGSAQSTAQSSINQTLSLTGATAATATYTVTPRNGTCAGNTFTATITIFPLPSVAITPDYCSVGGSVILQATAGLSNYLWSTGATTSSISVQQAGTYSVSASNANGCASTASSTIATELVTNGDFEAGNTGFTTSYVNNQTPGGLVTEGRYAIASNANTTHPSFYGTDHTSGTGNFMVVNGAVSIGTIWSQNNITVQPNTTYYFSAWGLTVNNGDNAVLQFSVNGLQVGSVAYLPNGYTSTSGPYAWTRFFGQWNSGNSTTVNLSIINLQTASGGNDFGLDDISFGTFAPVGLSIAPAANGGAAVCAGTDFYLNSNAEGGASPYTYAWTGPAGFTSSVANPTVSANASAALNGTYSLTVTDGLGCTSTSSSTVAVSALPTNLVPTAQASAVCAEGSTNVLVPTSQVDVGYALYNSATNTAVSEILPGDGNTLSIATGELTTNTTFYVVATQYATGCERQLSNTVSVSVSPTPVLQTNNISLCSGTANLTDAAVTAGSTGNGTLTYWTNATATTAVANPTAVNAGAYFIQSTIGSCSDIASVTVMVSGTPNSTFNYTGSPFCNNGVNPAPAFTGGATPGVFSATPSGLVFTSTSTGVIDLEASTPGTYTVTNTITPIGACTPSSTSRTITITGAPNANFGYLSNNICQSIGGNNPTPILEAGAQAGTFTSFAGLNLVSASTGEINLASSTPGSYAVINTVAATGGCPSAADTVFVDINPYTFAGSISASASDEELCLGEEIDLYSSGTSYLTVLERETFNGSFTPWTTGNTSIGGTPANAAWTLRQNNYSVGGNTYSSNDATQFYMSNSEAQGGGGSATTNTWLRSPMMNTIGFTTLSLDFYHHYNDNNTDQARVQVSTNNLTWTNVTIFDNADYGSRTGFVNSVANLNAYVGLPSVWVRFLYVATNDRQWAIDNVSITGNSTRYTYDWESTAGGFTSNEQNPSDLEPTVSAYYVSNAMNSFGCVVPSLPVPVVVNPLPADNAGDDKDLCGGSAANIGAASALDRTYSWSPSTGLSSASVSNPVANPVGPTTYTLTETIVSTGCSDTNQVYVNIRPLSVINNISTTACSGAAFNVSPVNGTNGVVLPGTTYIWEEPTGTGFTGGSEQTSAQSSIGQVLTNTASTSASAIYQVIPKVNGCDGAEFSVQVDISPSSVAGVVAGAGSVCAGTNSTQLSVAGTVGSIQWQVSNDNVNFTNISGADSTVFVATNISGTTYYRVTATSAPCAASNSSSAAITLLPNPTATISGSASICPDTPALLTLQLSGAGPWSGTLSNGQAFSGSNNQVSVVVNPTSSSTYTVASLSDANCSVNSGFNGAAVVSVRTLPQATISGSSVVCGGASANILFEGPANGEIEYSLNGTDYNLSLDNNGEATVSTGAVWQNLTYALEEVSDEYCENDVTGTAVVTYQEAPDATISGSAQLCSGQSTTIAFNGNANAVVTYNVNGGAAQNVTLNGSGNASVNTGALTANTTYNLVSVAVGSCSSTIGTSAVVSVGLTVYYQDSDGDGYGNAAVSTVACTQPVGYVTTAGDCCDNNANISPVCEWWADMDGDGYGSFVYEVGCISGASCSSTTWPAQLIPYCALANGGVAYASDCNDNSVAINPGAAEVCNNTTDDDCDGFIGEGCSGQMFDQWASAQLLNVNNTNSYYPNCQTVSGSMVNTDVSPQANPANVAVGGGRDVWYRFVAPTTGVRIQVTASGFNPVIELRTAAHPAGQVDVENANGAVGGTEVLNFGNLVVGQTYYVGVRNFDATNAGTYTICVSPLRVSGCASTPPAGGFTLCSSYKVRYTAATSYTLNFNGVGGTAAGLNSSVVAATGVVALSNPSLALRYGGVYNVRIDANYMLTNGLGQPDGMITVLGNSVPANCQNIAFSAQPLLEVRSTQVCPTILSRTGSISANPTSGNSNVCGAINYSFEFTRVSDCLGTNVIGSPFTITSVGSTASVALSSAFPAQLPSVGYWSVRVRPNFVNGISGNWGPSRIIAINGSAASQMLDSNQSNQQLRTFEEQPLSSVYPNPNSGNQVRIDLTDIGSGELSVKIMDGVGRIIYSKQFTVEGSLSTQLDFTEKLTAGIYLVEFTINGETMNERMVVER